MNKNVSEIFRDKRTEEQVFIDEIYVIMFLRPKQKIMFFMSKTKDYGIKAPPLKYQSSPPKVGERRRPRMWASSVSRRSRYTIARPTATPRSREVV